MKARKIMMATLAIVMAGFMTACSAVSMAEVESAKGVIRYVGSDNIEQADLFTEALKKDAKENGYQCDVSQVEEKDLMEESLAAFEKGTDVLVLAAGESGYAKDIVEAAHVNGVFVVLWNLGMSDADYDCIVGQDGEDGGALAAYCAMKLLEN